MSAWGRAVDGGDCSSVREQLCNVEALQATSAAFLALRKDGSVVCARDFQCKFDPF